MAMGNQAEKIVELPEAAEAIAPADKPAGDDKNQTLGR